MATKTWKLGEVCRGGVITTEANAKKVTIIAKEWDFSQGSNKGSNQSNAKEWNRLEVYTFESQAENKLYKYLTDLTSSYYAEKILEWINTKTKFTSEW